MKTREKTTTATFPAEWRQLGLMLCLLASFCLAVLVFSGPSLAAENLTVTITDVDLTAFPEAKATIQLGGQAAAREQAQSTSAFEMVADGQRVKQVEVAALAGDQVPTATVLLLDESGSMKGAAMASAQEAAARFLEAMGPEDQVALQAFNEEFRVLHGFTTDHASAAQALRSLTPRRETALYDAVIAGLASFEKLEGQAARYLLVLSDGGDTASKKTMEDAVAAARASGVQTYAIGLKSDEFDSAPLTQLAGVTGGRYVETPKPEDLASLYTMLAAEIQNRFVLTFNLPEEKRGSGAGKLSVTASLDDIRAESSWGFFYPDPLPATPTTAALPPVQTVAEPGLVANFVSWRGSAYLLALALFALLFAGGFLITRVLFPKRNVLTEYADILDNRDNLGPTVAEETLRPGERQVARVLKARDYQAPLTNMIENAGLNIRASEFVLFHVVGACVAVAIPGLLGASVPLVIGLGAAAVVGPLLYLRHRADKRRQAFEDQIPDLLTIMANSLRAGQSFEQAMAVVAEEGMEPASSEFRRLLSQQHLGISPEDSLRRLADRMRSEAFDWVVMATTIQRQVGGNLAELYQRIAATLRERQQLRREIRTLSAEGRISALILILLPFGIGGFILTFNREYASLLYTTTAGRVMLTAAGAGMVAGVIWIRRIISVEL
jgi:tight adherence protein B